MRLEFDRKISVGNILTILGGIVALAVAGATVANEGEHIRVEQAKIITRLDRYEGKQQSIAESLARIEGQLDRRRASLPTYSP